MLHSRLEKGRGKVDMAQGKKLVKATPKKIGRPTMFSQELADKVCENIANGISLRQMCAEDDSLPDRRTIREWWNKDETFALQIARAREEQADHFFEQIIEISQGTLHGKYDAYAARAAADQLKWVAGKLRPKVYGDKIDHTTNGKDLPTPILGVVAVQNEPKNIIDDMEKDIIEGEVAK